MSDEHQPYDFESPEEQKKRAHCAAFGHLTIHELEVTGATHGCKIICCRCGKYFHGEPTPMELPKNERSV